MGGNRLKKKTVQDFVVATKITIQESGPVHVLAFSNIQHLFIRLESIIEVVLDDLC